MRTRIRRQVRRGWMLLSIMTLVVVALSGAAFAYFRSTGQGTDTATTGTPVNITVNAATGSGLLHPNASGPAYFTLTNNNSFSATFNKITAATVVSNNTSACPSSNVSIVPTTFPYTLSPTLSVAANTTSATLSIPNLVKMASTAPNGCEGVTFNVTLTLSGTSN